jgi:hypothetical protein
MQVQQRRNVLGLGWLLLLLLIAAAAKRRKWLWGLGQTLWAALTTRRPKIFDQLIVEEIEADGTIARLAIRSPRMYERTPAIRSPQGFNDNLRRRRSPLHHHLNFCRSPHVQMGSATWCGGHQRGVWRCGQYHPPQRPVCRARPSRPACG